MTTLSDIDNQIKELQAQKAKLIADEKKKALKRAQDAVNELNALGYNYSLSETPASTSTRTRRPGIRAEVKKIVKANSGIARADILERMHAKGDKKAEQSISNALANLKKAGEVTLADGLYT